MKSTFFISLPGLLKPKVFCMRSFPSKMWLMSSAMVLAVSDATISDASLAILCIVFSAKINWMMFQPTSKVTRTPSNDITRFESCSPHTLLIRAKAATIRAVRDRYIDFITYNFRNSTVQI